MYKRITYPKETFACFNHRRMTVISTLLLWKDRVDVTVMEVKQPTPRFVYSEPARQDILK